MAAGYQIVVSREKAFSPVVLRFTDGNGSSGMTRGQFFRFCQINDALNIERTAQGDIVVMAPTGAGGGYRDNLASFQLTQWAIQDGTGLAFGASVGFELPNGATRSPDASWIKRKRWAKLQPHEKEVFAPLCPDFVIEVRSRTDRIEVLKRKMVEYCENGAQLGWLIDPSTFKVHIYQPAKQPKILDRPKRISGNPELPGFVLELAEIWKPSF
jgi:Uma2 family endonuclease